MIVDRLEHTSVVDDDRWEEPIKQLRTGIAEMIKHVRAGDARSVSSLLSELESINNFLDTLELIRDTLSNERLKETLRNITRSIIKQLQNAPNSLIMQLPDTFFNRKNDIPHFLITTIRSYGPDVRISSNHMKAWLTIDQQEAAFYRNEDLKKELTRNHVISGLSEDAIQSILTEPKLNQEILVAEGAQPETGRNGYIQYKIDVEELGYVPKLKDDGSVSFKDIRLFEYVKEGAVIAEKVAAQEGKPGYTVLNEPIQPCQVFEAEFPDCENTKTSKDGQFLIASSDCSVTKKNGRLILEPALLVSGDVSYSTGNIDSRVSVIVKGDVLSGFSISSNQTVCIQGVVEGAKIVSNENLVLKGGVHGKDKAYLEASGDIQAKSIAHATVQAMGNVTVNSQIINSKVFSMGRIVVSGSTAEIIGGELNADFDIIAATIGSEMGVRTVLNLGGRKEDLKALLLETQEKINEQEEILDKCAQVIFSLDEQLNQNLLPKEEHEKIIARTYEMQKESQQILDSLYEEADGIQTQIEACSVQSRTVRAKKNIFPGVLIKIDGVEMNIQSPTGPAMIIKEGSQLAVYPYKEI